MSVIWSLPSNSTAGSVSIGSSIFTNLPNGGGNTGNPTNGGTGNNAGGTFTFSPRTIYDTATVFLLQTESSIADAVGASLSYDGSKTEASFTQSKFGSTSLRLGNSSLSQNDRIDTLTAVNGSINYDPENSDFTIECWTYYEEEFVSFFRLSEGVDNALSMGLDPQEASINISLKYPDENSEIVNANHSFKHFDSETNIAPINEWIHVAVVNVGGKFVGYVNGLKVFETSEFVSFLPDTVLNGNITLSSEGDYLEEVRYTKGFARYVNDFTPPTAPFTLSDTYSNSDPHFGNVAVLIDGIEDLEDKMGNAFIKNNRMSVKLSNSKFGVSCAYFNGDDQYLNSRDSESFGFNDDDFTIELWVYPIDYGVLVDFRGDSNHGGMLEINSSGLLEFTTKDLGSFLSNTLIPKQEWSNIAVVRSENIINMFLNGRIDGSGNVTGETFDNSRPLSIGADYRGSNVYTGGMQCIRITKYIARYDHNFTVLNEPFPIANEVANQVDPYAENVVTLIRGEGTLVEETGKTITEQGDVELLSTGIAKFGNDSINFKNSNSFLQLAESVDFGFGTEEFTIELWFFSQDPTGNLLDFRKVATGLIGLRLDLDDGYIACYGGGFSFTDTTEIPVNTWTHVVLSRVGNSVHLGVNGIGSTTIDVTGDSLGNSSSLNIGNPITSNEFFRGYMEDIRITKGIGRHAGDYDLPTAPSLPLT